MNTVPGGKGSGWGLRDGCERMVLKSGHGKWLCAEHNTLVANRGEPGPWEKFTPIPQGGNTVALRSDFGKYMVAEKNGSANINREKVSAWEKFYVYKCVGEGAVGAGKTGIAFKSFAFNKFLVAEPNGTVNCNRDIAGGWEKWYGW